MTTANRTAIPCDYCGKTLYRIPYHIKHNKHHFCNSKCMGLYRRTTAEDKKKKLNIYAAKWAKNNPEKRRLYMANWRANNPERYSEIQRKSHNKPENKTVAKKWRRNNLDKCREYDAKRRLSASYRISDAMSASIRQALFRAKGNSHWCDLVGYTVEELKVHLKKLFKPGMTWGNYGKWHIDHKIPKSVFNFSKPEHEDFKRCWALSNLQPLWAKDNMSKHNNLNRPFQPMLKLGSSNDNCYNKI